MKSKVWVAAAVGLLSVWCNSGTAPAQTPGILPAPVNDSQMAARTDVDPRVRRYVMPARVVWHSSDKTVEKPEALLVRRSGQVTLDASNPCVLRNGKDGQAGVLLDFGKELHGGVQIMVWHTKDNKPVRLRVRFGESVSEAMAEFGGEKNTTNDHAIRDQSVLVPWLGTAEIGNTGFRFVRIDLEGDDTFAQIKMVRAVFLYRDLPYLGSFRCSDERLNRIWQTGAYTVHLNMQDYLWDGIKRDRLVWIGDMHPETMSVCAVFGASDVVPKSLDLIRDETPLPRWMNGISSYSMWWVLIHHSWYLHTGDKAYLQQQRSYLIGLLNLLVNQVGPDHRETMPPGRFLDWPSSGNDPAIHAGLHSLLVMTLRAGAELCEVIGEPATGGKCVAAIEKLQKHVPDPAGSKQAAALIALAGLDDPSKLNREVMAVDGPRRMSTFYGYYVLQARALAGDYQGAMDCIRQYWGAMLDLGATTFWEDFDLDWTTNAGRIDELVPDGKKDIHGDFGNYCYKGFRHSLCHGWASGPTAWLSEHVLGVKVVEPGCRVVRIEPHLGDLNWVEGTFPTPMGVIKVRHDKNADGTIRSDIQAPAGVKIAEP
ncbi:MAG: alpha-L-rhamnosidase [Phycisphaerae bacterium]|nr:alpha-L-rhamnosidase [Phycisphaerae bacterium]